MADDVDLEFAGMPYPRGWRACWIYRYWPGDQLGGREHRYVFFADEDVRDADLERQPGWPVALRGRAPDRVRVVDGVGLDPEIFEEPWHLGVG